MTNPKYKGKAIAGTASVNDNWYIARERVISHYSKTQTTATPEFVELIGVQIEQKHIGYNEEPIQFSYQIQA